MKPGMNSYAGRIPFKIGRSWIKQNVFNDAKSKAKTPTLERTSPRFQARRILARKNQRHILKKRIEAREAVARGSRLTKIPRKDNIQKKRV